MQVPIKVPGTVLGSWSTAMKKAHQIALPSWSLDSRRRWNINKKPDSGYLFRRNITRSQVSWWQVAGSDWWGRESHYEKATSELSHHVIGRKKSCDNLGTEDPRQKEQTQRSWGEYKPCVFQGPDMMITVARGRWRSPVWREIRDETSSGYRWPLMARGGNLFLC